MLLASKLVAKLLIILCLFTSGLQATPNFLLVNNASEPLHFMVLGVNDLFGMTKGGFQEPTITTLNPGEQYQTNIGLQGILPKTSQIIMFPHPQGQQPTVPACFKLGPHRHTLNIPIGARRIYLLNTTKPIEVELLSNWTLRPITGAAIKSHEIVRSRDFERLAQWSSQPKNRKKFTKLLSLVFPFTYEYLKAGSIPRFLWNWPLQGIPWALKIKWAESRFRAKTGIKLISQEKMDWYDQELGV